MSEFIKDYIKPETKAKNNHIDLSNIVGDIFSGVKLSEKRTIQNGIKKQLQEVKKDTSPTMSFIDKSENGLNITIERHNKDFYLEYIGSDTIYVMIDGEQYGEYIWDSLSNKYILQNHEDGESHLKIEKGKKYTITLSDKVIDNDYETYLSNNLDKEEMMLLYNIFTTKEEKIEKIKEDILLYLEKLIKKNNLNLANNEYIYYIDKATQRSFLIYYSSGKLEIIGYDKISTGNPNRKNKKHFETPDIIIDRTKNIANNGGKKIYKGDWRSLGTNSKGYGKKGSKIFNLGKYHIDENGDVHIVYEEDENGKGYIIDKKGNKKPAYANFHFAMHKTTPWATTKLGNKLSQGCVRSSPFSIDLLDKQNLFNGEKGKYVIVGSYNNNINSMQN